MTLSNGSGKHNKSSIFAAHYRAGAVMNNRAERSDGSQHQRKSDDCRWFHGIMLVGPRRRQLL